MRICCWNTRRAANDSDQSWQYLDELRPDVALLQEACSLPAAIEADYGTRLRRARGQTGNEQSFGTAVLVRGEVLAPIELSTRWDWVNRLLELYLGNLVALRVACHTGEVLNVVSVYTPPWPIPDEDLQGADISPIKSQYGNELWVSDLLAAALEEKAIDGQEWIVAGDLNSSITFDTLWGTGPRGNLEYQERMESLGLRECLRHHQGMLTPTFRNARDGKVVHQIDHLFASPPLQERLRSCTTGDPERVFGQSLSDHLPIVAEFT